MTNKYAILLAVIAVGVVSPAFAETYEVEVTEDGFSLSDITVNSGDTITFVNTHVKSNGYIEPHCISDPYAQPYTEESCWIIDGGKPTQSYIIQENQVFYDRFFDVDPIHVSVGVVSPAFAETPKWTYVFDGRNMPIMLDVKQGETLHFTGIPASEDEDAIRGLYPYDRSRADFNCEAGWNPDEYAVCIIDFSNFELGYHEWFDRTTDTWGKFYVMPPEITEDIVVVLEESNSTIQINSSETTESVLEKTRNFKAQIEAKMNEKLTPLKTEIDDLKFQLANSEEREKQWQSQVAELETERTSLQTMLQTAQDNAVQAQASIDQLSTANATIEQYKKDAENWKAVAFEQLRVMAEVLGLF